MTTRYVPDVAVESETTPTTQNRIRKKITLRFYTQNSMQQTTNSQMHNTLRF